MDAGRLSAASLAAAALIASSIAWSPAAEAPRKTGAHETHDAPADAPYHATSHRRFDDVDYWTKIFDDPERDSWQKPDEIVAALAIEPGHVVADLGAGTGYLAERLSRAVGRGGRVFAIEVEATLIEHIGRRAQRSELENLTPILASADDPRLPDHFVDLVVVLDTYHHLDQRDRYLARLARALRPGGRVAIIDWRDGELPVGPPPDHKLAREAVLAEMTTNGFRLSGEPTFLANQYFLIFELAAD
jgi:SAM-dependent methyltransferase